MLAVRARWRRQEIITSREGRPACVVETVHDVDLSGPRGAFVIGGCSTRHSVKASSSCCSRPRAASFSTGSFAWVAVARKAFACRLTKDLRASGLGCHRHSPGGTMQGLPVVARADLTRSSALSQIVLQGDAPSVCSVKWWPAVWVVISFGLVRIPSHINDASGSAGRETRTHLGVIATDATRARRSSPANRRIRCNDSHDRRAQNMRLPTTPCVATPFARIAVWKSSGSPSISAACKPKMSRSHKLCIPGETRTMTGRPIR
jgi:hypothetical protein